jgi:hypothetical protein
MVEDHPFFGSPSGLTWGWAVAPQWLPEDRKHQIIEEEQ